MGYSFLPLAFQSLFQKPSRCGCLLAVYLIVTQGKILLAQVLQSSSRDHAALVPGLGSGEPLLSSFMLDVTGSSPDALALTCLSFLHSL